MVDCRMLSRHLVLTRTTFCLTECKTFFGECPEVLSNGAYGGKQT